MIPKILAFHTFLMLFQMALDHGPVLSGLLMDGQHLGYKFLHYCNLLTGDFLQAKQIFHSNMASALPQWQYLLNERLRGLAITASSYIFLV